MASGAKHRTASIAASVPIAIYVAHRTDNPGLAILAGVGCLCGILFSPDLDIDSQTDSESVVWEANTVAGYLYQVAWYPYALALPHRSPLSHFPIIGTLGRLVYLQLMLFHARIHLRGWLGIEFDSLFWMQYPAATMAWAGGLAVSDALHWVMDGCPLTGQKRRRKRRSKGVSILMYVYDNRPRLIEV